MGADAHMSISERFSGLLCPHQGTTTGKEGALPHAAPLLPSLCHPIRVQPRQWFRKGRVVLATQRDWKSHGDTVRIRAPKHAQSSPSAPPQLDGHGRNSWSAITLWRRIHLAQGADAMELSRHVEQLRHRLERHRRERSLVGWPSPVHRSVLPDGHRPARRGRAPALHAPLWLPPRDARGTQSSPLTKEAKRCLKS